MSSPMIPNAGDYNSIYGGDPINPNPNPDVSAGYADSVPPPPGSGSQEAQQPPYAAMQAPGNWRDGGGNGLRNLIPTGITDVGTGFCGLLWGVAGAMLACCAGKQNRKITGKIALKGAAGGIIACMVTRKISPGGLFLDSRLQAALGIGAGYGVSKWWR